MIELGIAKLILTVGVCAGLIGLYNKNFEKK